MPYVPQDRRLQLSTDDTVICTPNTPGELNYMITCLIKQYQDIHGLSYKTINDIVGALEGAKMEYYRRVAVPYEDGACERNGDVY